MDAASRRRPLPPPWWAGVLGQWVDLPYLGPVRVVSCWTRLRAAAPVRMVSVEPPGGGEPLELPYGLLLHDRGQP